MTPPSAPSAVLGRLDRVLGGSARRRVVVTFAAVLAIDSADKATIGASSTQLQDALGIGRPEIGLLLALSSAAGLLVTLPAGVVVDRVVRTRLLAGAMACAGVACLLSGAAPGFGLLAAARVVLGAAAAVAAPAIASLIGDWFADADRGRVYGWVLAGELAGAGFGFVVAGQLAALSWRAPFLLLAVPSALAAWSVRRMPEPSRDGSDQLLAPDATEDGGQGATTSPGPSAHATVLAEHVVAREASRPRGDPARMTMRAAFGYVLRIPTNVALIVASALAYFFFSGARGFAIELIKQHYGLGQSAAAAAALVLGLGAIAGVLTGGRLADTALRRGRLRGVMEIPGVAAVLAAILFAPALLVRDFGVALVLLTAACACLGAASPPLDAARLDVVHPAVWGRAEAVRSVLRTAADTGAPLLFGIASARLFHGPDALRDTFLVSLVAVVAAGAVVLGVGRRTFPGDAAAAARGPVRDPAA